LLRFLGGLSVKEKGPKLGVASYQTKGPFSVPDATSAFRPERESVPFRVQNQVPKQSVEFLSDVSPKQKPWDIHHTESQLVAALYRQSDRADFQRLAERMELCAPCLEYSIVSDPVTRETHYTLLQVYLCRIRHCPSCAWRKSLKWKARMYEALPHIEEAYPSHRWLFLTVTVRNPPMAQLKATLKAMRAGWRNMVRYKDWSAIGAVRSMEITLGQDGRPHPHYHALILVPAGYFKGKNYRKHSDWVAMWKRAMQLDYDPSVNIKPVKPRAGDVHPMEAAIAECLKYSIKPSDITSDAEYLWALTDQLRGTRAVEVFGALKPFLAQDADDEDEDRSDERGIPFPYQHRYERYGRRRGPQEAS
jgi:plasmid rolling circle replication initiator protein Rep